MPVQSTLVRLSCNPYSRTENNVMPSFYTVIPLHNVDLDPDGRWDFAGGFALSALPGWMGDQQILERLSAGDRAALEQATHSLVVAYEAEALGTPDPDNENRSIQETKYQHGVLANLALWLSRPSPVRFIIAIHAPQLLEDHPPVVQQTLRVSPLLCHPADKDQRITEADLGLAARLHDALLALREGTSMWTATRALWAGLTINMEPVRYALFWIALEALFGPDDPREITYRLSQRVGFFLGKTPREAQQLFTTTKKAYGFRSKIVHGRWQVTDLQRRMGEAESLARQSLVQILEDTDLTETFSGQERERFLDDLLFNRPK